MALCPVMSTRGEEVSCKEKNCEWWVEVEGRPSIGDCAVRTIAHFMRALRDGISSDLTLVARAISKTGKL